MPAPTLCYRIPYRYVFNLWMNNKVNYVRMNALGIYKVRLFLVAYLAGECYVAGGKSTTYDGILAQTVDGHTCQRWDSNSPHQHNYHDASKYPDATLADAENYCRDPSASGYTWCYTTNTNVRWQQCGVTQCLAGKKNK